MVNRRNAALIAGQDDIPDMGDPDRKRMLNVIAQRRYSKTLQPHPFLVEHVHRKLFIDHYRAAPARKTEPNGFQEERCYFTVVIEYTVFCQ